MATKINGFGEKEIMTLYTYLAAYENFCEKHDYNSDEEFFKKHPEYVDLKNIISEINYSTKENTSQIAEVILDEKENKIVGTRYHSVSLSFLYHLRNSIAHAYIRKVGKSLYMEDKTKNKPRKLTAKGYMESISIIAKITDIINGENHETH